MSSRSSPADGWPPSSDHDVTLDIAAEIFILAPEEDPIPPEEDPI